jgi:hypothetical protein
MSELQNNMTTTIHLEALKVSKEQVMQQLTQKIQYVQAQYNKEEISENEFKALQRNEDFIRLILSLITGYDATIEAIAAENQKIRGLYNDAANDAKFWHTSYLQESKSHLEYMGIIADKFKQFRNPAA